MNKEILHLGKHYYPDFGGIETATQNLAEVGIELGQQVKCYTSSTKPALGKRYTVNDVQIKRFTTFGRFLSTPITPRSVLPLLTFKKVVLLHPHLPNPLAELSALASSLLNKKRIEIVPFFHAMPFRGQGIGKIWYQFITRRLLEKSKAILVSSVNQLDAFPILQEFKDKITVMPFIVNAKDRALVSNCWKLRNSEEKRVVVAIGRIVPYKGLDVLVDAWNLAGLNNCELVIIGDGPNKQRLSDVIEKLNLSNSVRIISKCSDVEKEQWLKRASLFVLPSINASETFGIAAQEAMAFGLPVLTTDVKTGLAELARNGECGAVVKAGDAKALAAEMNNLLSMPSEKLMQIGLQNLEFIAQNYSFDQLVNNYEKLLQQLDF